MVLSTKQVAMKPSDVERWAAFSDDPGGGNPAGVWIGQKLPEPQDMQNVALAVNYSETAFLAPATEPERWTVRYFSPAAEVDFCGHATIASAVALRRRFQGSAYLLDTVVGVVPVTVERVGGSIKATLTSVVPNRRDIESSLLDDFLWAMSWSRSELDPELSPEFSFAGAWHLVLPVLSRGVLSSLHYDFQALRSRMLANSLTTVQVVWRESPTLFHSRNPFPVGGVVEDPATGAAAAALGGYLRYHRFVQPPVDIEIKQGYDMGRPSTIEVHVPRSGGMEVTGSAVAIDPRLAADPP